MCCSTGTVVEYIILCSRNMCILVCNPCQRHYSPKNILQSQPHIHLSLIYFLDSKTIAPYYIEDRKHVLHFTKNLYNKGVES